MTHGGANRQTTQDDLLRKDRFASLSIPSDSGAATRDAHGEFTAHEEFMADGVLMPTTILSWNVNGMRSVLRTGFLQWLDTVQPDIVCVQESRVSAEQLQPQEREPKGYTSFWMGGKRPGYAGVGMYTRLSPLNITDMRRKEFDCEGRVQIAEFPEFTLINSYWPNSQPERKRIEFKLKFSRAMRRLCNQLVNQGKNVIVCGDFNIAHKEIDLARPKQNVESPGFRPEERDEMTRFLKAGYVDTFRHFCPEPGHYSWWSYRTGARKKNVGWRIDYHVVNKDFLPRVRDAKILCDVYGSDHCPVAVTVE